MKRLIKNLVAVTTALALLTGCDSPLKSAKEAADGSKRSADNSKKAADNSERAANTSDSIKTYNEKLGENIKSGGGSEARDDDFDKAIEAKDFILKTKYAAKYFLANAFQLTSATTDTVLDLEAARTKNEADSVREFIKNITSLMPVKFLTEEISATDDSNENQTLAAFASAMHEISYNQTINLKDLTNSKIKIESFFDIITRSLALRPDDLAGKINRSKLSLADREVLREAPKLIYMLKLRYKILPVVALARMSNIQYSLMEKIKMRYFHWDIKQGMGTEEINYINDIFDRAETTKNFLESIGETVELDSKVVKIYENLNTDLGLSVEERGAQDNFRVEALNKLNDHLMDIETSKK